MSGACSACGVRRGVYRVLVGETGGEETTWKNQAQMGG